VRGIKVLVGEIPMRTVPVPVPLLVVIVLLAGLGTIPVTIWGLMVIDVLRDWVIARRQRRLEEEQQRRYKKERNEMRERDLSFDERSKWGDCPTCKAPDGTYCYAAVGVQLGRRADGRAMQDGEGAHLSRLQNAPTRVREVPVKGA
jgi:hypothetical protein